MTTSIPVIRLDDPDLSETVQKLRKACIEVGFFYLEGHGLDPSFLEAVFHQSKSLFDLPLETKNSLTDPETSRGYTGMEEETLDPARQTKGDTKEGFYICRHVPPEDPRYNPAKLRVPNIWPRDMPDFRSTMEAYYEQMAAIAYRVVELIALALDLPKDHFQDDFSFPLDALRLLHYAAEDSHPDEGVFACGAHSDYGMITLLLTDDHPGLQILSKDNHWIDAPPRPGALIVNLGDMLERWTNGLFRSTLHRVVTQASQGERYSIPFFYEPNFDCVVECLPSCCSKDHPAKYPPTTSGEHLLEKYRQTHADFKGSNEEEVAG